MKILYTSIFTLMVFIGCNANTVELITFDNDGTIKKDSLVKSVTFNLNGEIIVNNFNGDSYMLTSEQFGRIQFLYSEYSNVRTFESNSKISFYPNPAKDIAKVSNLKGVSNFEIISSNGQVVYRFSSSETEQKIDISRLPNGIYFLLINNKDCIKFQKE